VRRLPRSWGKGRSKAAAKRRRARAARRFGLWVQTPMGWYLYGAMCDLADRFNRLHIDGTLDPERLPRDERLRREIEAGVERIRTANGMYAAYCEMAR
jgi:hypothetical protein